MWFILYPNEKNYHYEFRCNVDSVSDLITDSFKGRSKNQMSSL